jgi:hypothetical protein
MGDFLAFKKFITPLVIQIIFWIGVIVCLIYGIIMIVSAGQIIGGILVFILGPIFVRIYCEVLMIFFRIHDRLASIDDKTK